MAEETGYEIADVIAMELVNEYEFMTHIKPFIERVAGSYGETSKLQEAIEIFQNNQFCCRRHTHKLAIQDSRVSLIVTVEVLKHYWEQYSDKEFNSSSHVPCHYHDAYKNKKSTPEFKPEPEPEKLVTTNMAELELRVLAKYADNHNSMSQKLEYMMKKNRFIESAIEAFKAYQQGRWAWRTVCKQFEGYAIQGAHYTRDANELSLINIFTVMVYQKVFKDLIFPHAFNRWDIPLQCRYLFDEDMFSENILNTDTNGWLDTPHIRGDTHNDTMDAASYIFASGALKEASERQFTKQNQGRIFRKCPAVYKHLLINPKEDSIMKLVKVETVTRIDNTDASEYSDDDIFALIAKIEKDIEKLEAIAEKPKKLEAKIKAMRASITALGKIVDARD